MQRIEDKKRLGALKRSPPPLPQRDAQRAKIGVNALTFNTPRDGPPQGPSPPTPAPSTAGHQEHGTKRRLPSGLTGGIASHEEQDSRNRTCASPSLVPPHHNIVLRNKARTSPQQACAP